VEPGPDKQSKPLKIMNLKTWKSLKQSSAFRFFFNFHLYWQGNRNEHATDFSCSPIKSGAAISKKRISIAELGK